MNRNSTVCPKSCSNIFMVTMNQKTDVKSVTQRYTSTQLSKVSCVQWVFRVMLLCLFNLP